MKNRKHVFGLLMAATSLILSACSFLPENFSARRKSNQEESQEVESSNEERVPSSNNRTSSKTSSSAPRSSSNSSRSSSSNQRSSSSNQSSASAQKMIGVTESVLVQSGSKAWVRVRGYQENYTIGSFRWGWGLCDEYYNFIDGGLDTNDVNFYAVSFDSNNNFEVSYCITDFAGSFLEDHYYRIYGGTPEFYGEIAFSDLNATASDDTYMYYCRADHGNLLACEKLSVVTFTEAKIIIDSRGKYWAKIGGPGRVNLSQEELDNMPASIDFQQVGGSWRYYARNKANGEYYLKLEGTNVYLYVDVSFFEAGCNYVSHINIGSTERTNCYTEGPIDEHYSYRKDESTWLDVNVYSNPNGSSTDQNEFWGVLGFKVSATVESRVYQAWVGDDFTSTIEDPGVFTTVRFDDGTIGYMWKQTNNSSILSFQSASTCTASLNLLMTAKYSMRDKTGFWKQGTEEKTRITINGDVLDAQEPDIDFSVLPFQSNVSNNGYLAEPGWFNIINFQVVAGNNTIEIEHISGGYSFYLCGAMIIQC